MRARQPVMAIVGPTCTGKTRLAVSLARQLAPAELVNADSRQLLRGLAVGTCSPTAADLEGVRCHLLDEADPGDDYTVADWLRHAEEVLSTLDQQSIEPVIVGGTGLYVTALIDGYDLGRVAPQPELRAERTRMASTASGRDALVAEVTHRDPTAAATLDLHNPRRVVRALELIDAAGSLAAARRASPRPSLLIGLDVPRGTHAEWVQRRCDAMFGSGALVDETERALQRGWSRATLRRSGIGYAEALEILDGTIDVAAGAARAVQRTLRYAKAQRTYFHADARVHWLDANADRDTLLDAACALRDATRRADL
ncbi:MAG: tRNA (adenosine(37)-N6)-dimethylallyltransferase MiaA [Candidatus Dormibacteria bacterium]